MFTNPQWAMGRRKNLWHYLMTILKTTTNMEQIRKELGQKLYSIKSDDDFKLGI